jgi:hypothetical protein
VAGALELTGSRRSNGPSPCVLAPYAFQSIGRWLQQPDPFRASRRANESSTMSTTAKQAAKTTEKATDSQPRKKAAITPNS